MKRIRKIIFGIVAAAMLVGCAEDNETDDAAVVQEKPTASQQEQPSMSQDDLPTSQEYMHVTVNASVESDQSLSKIFFTKVDNSLDLLTNWMAVDRISLYARQGDKCFYAGTADVANVSADGKTCSFDIKLPVDADAGKDYVVYGFCGIDVKLNGTDLVLTEIERHVPFNNSDNLAFKVPMMFVAPVNASTINVEFKHIGTYELLHVVNKSGFAAMGVAGIDYKFKFDGYTADYDWYYRTPCAYDMKTSSAQLKNVQASFDFIKEPEETTLDLVAGGDITILSWYIPNGNKISNATLNAVIDGSKRTSTNTKTSNVEMKVGNAYHLYATCASELKFVDRVETEVSPSITYRLNTQQYVYVGEQSQMKVITNIGCYISVLINGNKVAESDNANATSLEVILPTDTPGEYDVTLKASSGGIDAKVETFKFGVREKFEATYKTFDICGVPVEFVYVKGGTFRMGGTSEQGADAQEDEFPVHSVSLDDFYIGKFEVTRQLYKAVMGGDPAVDDDKYPQGDMSWNSANEFINKLRETTGMDFRLPTESEWEYAARGGQRSKCYKYAGSNLVGMVAHYDKNTAGTLQPCGTKMNNELGIFDMSGNVWEFVSDPYGGYPEDPVYNPQGSGSYLGLRGGGFRAAATDCRVSRRIYVRNDGMYDGKGNSSWDFGIRLVVRP
ncbi:MAG: SUMF1/EgtB/PvdO family nonheme iron enzyme [Bacteroidales bacterium]|nr:SUMF1/EgtB/PvdO family nonheme iron enzyme [Bacteroidales bacterium]